MKAINQICRMSVFLTLAFLVVIPNITTADDSENIPDDLSVHGKWYVTYTDQHLGIVSGQARIDEYTSKATMVLVNPRTDEEFLVTSTKYQRTGKKITIEFEGMQPFRWRDDGTDYPNRHLIVPQSTRKVEVRYGANQAAKTLAARKESDLDKITLELTIIDFNKLDGEWSYRADPFTKRERDGGGRVGIFELLDDGTGRQFGKESWVKPEPYIMDTFVLQDQTGYIGDFSDLPKFPYVIPRNSDRKKSNSRTLVIFGENLPQSSRRPVVFTSDSENVTYTGTRFGRNMTNVYDAEVLAAAKEKLLSLYPKLDFAVDKLDYVVVRAILKEGILPGDYSFTMNGAEGGWRLKYGDNNATVNIARRISPRSAGANGIDSEFTYDAFMPETVHIEVRTNVELDVEKINVMLGKNGEVWKFDEDGPVIPAYREPEWPRIFRTRGIMLIKTDHFSETKDASAGETIGKIGDTLAKGKKQPYKIPVDNGDLLTVSIAHPGLISLEPQPGTAFVRVSPSQKEVDTLFKDALVKAVNCVNYMIRRDKQLPAVINTVESNNSIPFVKEVEEIMIEDWDKLPHTKIEELSRIRVFWWDKLQTTIQLGDYAAMILQREIFIDLMRNKIEEFKKIETKKDILAFRHAFEPHVRDLDHVMRWMQVTGPDGNPMFFTDTYRTSNRSNSYGSRSDTMPPWVQKATKEAIAQYIEIMEGSLKTAEKLSLTGDIKDLLFMTGRSFNAVAKYLKPRMMTLEETSTNNTRQVSWTPDYWARTRIWKVEYLAERVKTFDDLADTDTKFIYGAAAIIAIPVGAWCGTAGYVAGIILEVADVCTATADSFEKYFESQAEVEFARGTIDVLGYQRLEVAKSEEFDMTSLAVELGYTALFEAGGEVGGRIFGQISNSVSQKVMNLIRIRQGKKLLAKYNYAIDSVPGNLSEKNHLDMLAFMAHTKRLGAAGHKMSDNQAKILKQMDALELKQKLAAEATTNITRPSPEPKTSIETPAKTEQPTPELTPQEKAKAEIDEMLPDKIKHLYYRKDILHLMQDAGETVTAALRSDPEKALRILNHTPQITKQDFDRAFNSRYYTEPEMRGKDSYDITDENHQAGELLAQKGWEFKYEDHKFHSTISVKAPNNTADKFHRFFDPETGTLKMQMAYREHLPSHIDIGLPNATSDKGWPTFLFAQLRFLKRVDVGYAGQDGNVMKSVYMDSVTNARTKAQLSWYMKTRFPGRNIEDVNNEGLLDNFLRDTRSVQYAESVISMAGYRITKARLEFYGDSNSKFRIVDTYKVGSDGETWEQFLKRHDLTLDSNTPPGFDIVIEVEPAGAIRKMASGENTPPLPPQKPGPSTSSEFDPMKTKTFPAFEPPSDLPASVVDARKQADEMYQRARETHRSIIEGEHKTSEDIEISEVEAARLNDMVKTRNIQNGIEVSVREARKVGVPEEEIEKILKSNLRLMEVTPVKSREGAYVDLQRAIELRKGNNIVGIRESENLQEMITHAELGKMTRKDLNLLAEGIAEAKWNEMDYFEELSKTGTFNVHMQQEGIVPLYQSDFEFLTNEAGINRLRNMARKHGLLGEQEPDIKPAEDFDVSDSLSNMRRQNQQDINDNVPGAREHQGRLDSLDERLRDLTGKEMLIVNNAAEGMKRLGVPEFKAINYATDNIRMVLKNDTPANATAQLVAESIFIHGTARVTIKTFVDIVRLNSLEEGKNISDKAAQRLGYAPLESEICPGWLYPPTE